ncbi:MAG: hypothetical protein AA908_05225 [Chlorobi bacterium NICIL-2]|jgi:signal transduction histidine kinase/Tfp pilus assembly protein PilF|nr:MAG: hypothetical protein AA908_05225 [Chlorobi bacterium NICIL-2]
MEALTSDRDIAADPTLASLLERAPDDATRIELLIARARQLQSQHPQQAIAYAHRALELAEQHSFAKAIAESKAVLGYAAAANAEFERAVEQLEDALTSYAQLGNRDDAIHVASTLAGLYFKLSRFDKALLHLHNALSLCEQSNIVQPLAALHSNIASIYQELGQLDLALEHYLKALDIKEQHGKAPVSIAVTINNIASVYFRLGHFETALDYTQQALAWLEHEGQEQELLATLENMGRIFLSMQRYDEALEYLSKALSRAYRIGAEYNIAMAIFLIGKVHRARGDSATALSYLAMALSLFRKLNAQSEVSYVLDAIAQCYRLHNAPRRALRYYKQAIEVARQTQSTLLEAELAENVSQILEELGHYQTALVFFRRSTELRRRILADDAQKLIAVMETRHKIQQEAREKEIYRLRSVELANALSELQEKTAALQSAYEELEQQQAITAQINTQLQQANERLATLDRERSELLSIVTHDLKNLVASIKISAETLRHPKVVNKLDQVQKLAARILEVTDNMQHLITSLLDVSALEAGKLSVHLQPVAAHSLASKLVERYQPHASAKSITLLASLDQCWAMADPVRLEEVFDNLLSNAIKYTPPGGEVRILLGQRGDAVRFVVSDTGPGFTDQDKQKLFTKFQRLSARPTGGESSTGLGLAIAKRLVELMHGRIWLESSPGEGAIFYVEVPSAEQSASDTVA